MLLPQLALIIGAGASHDLHHAFALGDQLLKDISGRVTDRATLASLYLSTLLERSGFDQEIRERFVEHIEKYKRSAESPSIDGFMDEVSLYPEFRSVKESFKRIAKFSIVYHILGYEGVLKHAGLQPDAWIDELAIVIEKYALYERNAAVSGRVKIITFNYDRTIEHFLYHHELFKGKQDKIKRFIDESIFHVYGKVGDLEWQHPEEHFAFGEDNTNVEKILANKDRINLMFDERLVENREPFDKLWSWIHGGPRNVCCFGFNFDLINHRLLRLQDLGSNYSKSRLIANIYPGQGGNFDNRRIMANKIRNVKHDVQLTYMSCTEFLKFVFSNSASSDGPRH